MSESVAEVAAGQRMVAVVGRLGVHPPVRLSLPARRLIAYLALRGRQPVARGVVSADLWPDCVDESGRANLRRALWHLPPRWVAVMGDDLLLDAETDLARAEQAAGRALAGEPLSFEEISLLSQDLLPGWHEEWALAAHERFRLLRVQALEAACRSMAAFGRHALATQAGAAAVAAEPLRESAAEALIDAHLAQRNRYEAVQCYRSLARRLDRELGVSPDQSLTERLVDVGAASALIH
ncbi:MAG TPA: BTAD domain-containing putative transcriptional regulator [Allosphingosinicella sp.]|jgi:DNA-binding SARP family transcriptional activator|nr:BTAD domain-containing putative transcriptional regulator [Allosphingosinicella sp.]